MNITTLFERLKTEWVPEFDTFDGRYRLCCYCLEKNALPFRGECHACYEKERDRQEKRIRRRKHSGYTDNCNRCQMPYYDVYVTSSESYSIRRALDYYEMDVSVGWCSLCTSCVEWFVSHPACIGQDYVVWDRNIRLIRKVADGQLDKTMLEACSILAGLDF